MTREWRIGSVFVVRHAGMPFDWLEALGAVEEVLDAAEELLDCEEALRAIAGDEFGRLERAITRCEPGQLPSVPAAWREAVEAWRTAVDCYTSVYTEADWQSTEKLRSVVERPEVAEAVLLSNPDAYRNMLRPMLSHDGPLTSRRRRARRQLYTYVQRFCAKNETVSFFGPMAYGTVLSGGSIDLRTDQPRRRRVFLSHWAGRALSRAIARDSRILPDLVFHRTLAGDISPLPDSTDRAVAAAARAVFRQLDSLGSTLRSVARATELPATDVARALRVLLASGAVDVGLGHGPYDLEPLRTLRGQLLALPPTPSREAWLNRVDALESCRDALETGAPDDKEQLIAALENAFTAATGEPARRAAGATYADRAVFFEESSSPFALQVGSDLVKQWQERLCGLLEACVAHGQATQRSAAAAVRAALGEVGRTDLDDYAARATATFTTPGSTFVVGHAPPYRADNWQTEISALQQQAAGTDGDRYALIDLCVKAPDADGLRDGELVVARVHHHLLVRSWLATMHPDPDRFAADADEWVAEQEGRLVGFDFGRRNKGYYRFPGREVAMRAASWTDSYHPGLLRPGDLTVATDDDGIRLLDPVGESVTAYLPLNDFAKYAPFAALSHPQVAHPVFAANHEASGELPEIHVNGVVCQRARWSLDTRQLDRPTPDARFLELRRIARRTGQRFLYCRSARERKPYLVDLASPLAADLVAHIARGNDTLMAEAMSPDSSELWLRDEQGQRYTCELRMQVIGRQVAP